MRIILFLIIAVALLFGAGWYSRKIDVQSSGEKQISEGGLQKIDIAPGTGAEAKNGDKVRVHYRGTLSDGKVFDNSYDRGEPIEFTIGRGEVIKGWDQGIPGMKVGGKRKLTIPSELGYGKEGFPGSIPPNAVLTFEVELVAIK